MQTQQPSYQPPPPPQLNGGLYTGKPFRAGAPWANVPQVPDAGFLMHVGLRSARPPPGARFHLPGGGVRPGNNTPILPDEVLDPALRLPDLNLVSVPNTDRAAVADTPAEAAGYRAFAYLS